MRYIHTVCLFQNFILIQSKWEIFFQFFTKLTRYSSALQIKLLSVFDQTENSHIFLIEIEATICHKLTGRNAQRHDFLTDENAQKHNFLTETVKSLSVWHEIICNQSDLWSSSYLQWQYLNQTLCLRVCFSNTTTVLLTHSKCGSCKLIDESWY